MLRPYLISTDLQAYHRDIIDYCADPLNYHAARDGALDGFKFTSASASFSDKYIGKMIAVCSLGYAEITAVTSDTEITLSDDFGIGKGDSLRFCAGAFARLEKTAFDMLKYELLNGYDNKLFEVSGPGLRKITGNFQLDFISKIADDSEIFNEAHTYAVLYRVFLEQSVQGGETWQKQAYDFGKMYYGYLATAIHSFAQQLKDNGTVAGVQQKDNIVFASMYRR